MRINIRQRKNPIRILTACRHSGSSLTAEMNGAASAAPNKKIGPVRGGEIPPFQGSFRPKNKFKVRLRYGWGMDGVTIGLFVAIFLQIWVTISLFKQLTEHINDLMTELVEDLPPALGEAMSGSMGEIQGMSEFNPIQMAIAQLIPNLVQPKLEVKEISRDLKGKFESDNL